MNIAAATSRAHTRRALTIAAATAAATLLPTPAHATIRTWQGADNANWSLTTAWVGGVTPQLNDDVQLGYVGSGSSLTANLNVSPPSLTSLKINANNSLTTFTLAQNSSVTLTAATEIIGDTLSGNVYNQGAGTNNVTNLIFGNTSAGGNAYNLSAFATLNAANITIGNAGTGAGTFAQSGGTANLSGQLIVGNDASFSNQVQLSGGTLNLTNSSANISVGMGTTPALFNQTGGTLNASNNSIYLGNSASSVGNYSLSGTALLNASYLIVGEVNSGSVTQSGGTANLTSLFLSGLFTSSVGTYNLSAGTLTTTNANVGTTGHGVFNQSGGTHNTLYLDLGYNVGSAASYNLSGGTLNLGTPANSGTLTLADYANATFTQTAGTLNGAYGQASLGNVAGATGSYFMKGGSATFNDLYLGYNQYGSGGGTGSFVQSGGSVSLTDTFGAAALAVGGFGGSFGSYTLSNGDGPASLTTTSEGIGSGSPGSFVQYGGTTHTVTNYLFVGGNGGFDGSYYQAGGSLIANSMSLSFRGTFTQYGSVTVNSSLDIGAGSPNGPAALYYLNSGTLALAPFALATTHPGGTLAQYGGTFAGTLSNAGTLQYHNGVFNAFLDNAPSGTLDLDTLTPLIANKGIANRGSITLLPNVGLGAASPATLDNQNSLTLAGGTLTGTGAILNNASLTGWGNIAGSGGFINNDTLNQGAGTLLISNTGANINNGSINLAAGQQLQLATNLTNAGSLNLNSALVNGATLTNNLAGILSGPGTLAVLTFSNAGTLYVPTGTTRVQPNWTNTGLVQLNSVTAALTGGALSNPGSIQGQGKISNAVLNSGTITPAPNATLTLSFQLNNTGLLVLPPTSKLLVTGSFSSNPGTVNLQGGTLDTNNQPLSNDGIIAGFGTLSTGGLTNNASITLTGGSSTVTGPVTNAATKTIEIRYNPALFTGTVTNNGTIKITGAGTATFAGNYIGTPPSAPTGLDPSSSSSSFILQPSSFSSANDGGVSGSGSILVADPAGVVAASYLRQSSLTVSGTVQIRPSLAGGQTSVLSSLTLLPNSTLDLADTKLILDYTGPTPHDTLRSYLQSNRLTSSIATGDPQHRLGIGYLENSLKGVATWGGQSADSTSLLTDLTYLGDANLDGKIDADDFALIDKGFRNHSTTWALGDFNYDGQVTSADYLLIDKNYTLQSGTYSPDSALLADRLAQFGPDYVSALLAAVPEPALALSSILYPLSSLLLKRPRSRRRLSL